MDENCHVEPVQKIATEVERKNIDTAILAVWGMGCSNCAMRVRNSLLSLNGVVHAYVTHEYDMAEVAYNPELTSVEMLIGAVAQAGGDGRHEYRARAL